MLKVLHAFVDKYDPEKVYNIGEIIEIEDKERIKDMIARKLVEETKDKVDAEKVKVIKGAE